MGRLWAVLPKFNMFWGKNFLCLLSKFPLNTLFLVRDPQNFMELKGLLLFCRPYLGRAGIEPSDKHLLLWLGFIPWVQRSQT